MTDLELLRQYEPILRFTAGEIFFPCPVEPYVERCSLWARARGQSRAQSSARLRVPAGSLSLDTLAGHGACAPEETLFLRFVQEPLTGLEYQLWRLRERPPFQAPGRLARVGLAARFIDSLFSLSLLLRGTVPGGTTAAAARAYQTMLARSPDPIYYGRVLRRDGYIILHYQFFYVMNDWRSSFAGVNDHEADWEQVIIYLEDGGDAPSWPAWIACAAHDFAGDDLRRRWDDPELTIDGTHPVVFIGAGSHAAYFQPGEYLLQMELQPLEPVLQAVHAVRRVWRDVLRQGEAATFVRRIEGLLHVPFVDYARGDGRAIGSGQGTGWSPVLIDDDVCWVDGYRGLWGLDTQDIFAGELAPAGPKYMRDGSVRRSWHDPLGWAGLSKVAPASVAEESLGHRLAALEQELADTDCRIAALQAGLPGLDLEVRALRGGAHLRRLHAARAEELARQEQELQDLRARRVEMVETIAACRRYGQELAAGHSGDPRAHIRRAHQPESPSVIRRGILIEVWAALSTGLLLLGGIALLASGVKHEIVALAMLVATVVIVENILHRRVQRMLLDVTIAMALATTLVLVYEFFWPITIGAIAGIAALILVDNIRELRGR